MARREGTASRLRRWVVVYLKGVCMGAADSVPGVSGGTIALIAGIYERLIGSLTAIGPRRILRVLAGVSPSRRDDARRAFRAMDAGFLLVLGVGIFSAIVTVTRVLAVALDAIPVLTFGFFFGLIGASALVLYGEVSLSTNGRCAAAAAGFILAFVVSGRAAASAGHGLAVTAAAGTLAVSAMILPGISGSLILILLGQYEFLVEQLHAFVDAVVALPGDGTVAQAVAPGTVVVAFIAGAVVGLFTVAHVVRWALERNREATLAFLVSLVVGALRAPVVSTGGKLAEAGRTWTLPVGTEFAVAALVGGAFVVLLDRYAGLVEY